MRGKEDVVICQMNLRRITPAHAGKSLRKVIRESEQEDHPRTCGEKMKMMFHLLLSRGSPPHMRGKAKADFLEGVKWRITPAHAGKSILA